MRVKLGRSSSRTTRAFAVAAASALVLVACGGDDGTSDEPTAEEPADAGTDDSTEGSSPEDGGEATQASGEADCSFYEGNRITLATGSSPGGGYDAYMRLLAPHLEDELGATVVPENQTGGGGLLMINNAANAAEQDGSTLMLINGIGAASAALSGAEGVQFDLEELSYVGMVASEPPVLVVNADSEFETLEDLQAADGLIFGATGVASSANTNALALISALGLDATVATAFEGSSELEVALLAGDVDAFTGSFDSRVDSVENGETRALLVVDDKSDEPFSDVPNVTDIGDLLVEGGAEVMDAHLALTQFHRPLATHPGIPPERLACLRNALANVMEDPDVIAESQEIDRPLNHRPGEEVAELANRVMNAPDVYVDVVSQTAE
jgi:tripartite-type tricarboxylate transporter receptor subunit TctC